MKNLLRNYADDALLITGCALVVCGVAMVSIPLALITAGLMLIGLAVLIGKAKSNAPDNFI